MEKRWLLIGFVLIFIGIILGAFGAHALKDALHDSEKLQSFETGVKYQIYHGLAIIALVVIGRVFQLNFLTTFRLLFIGLICFSVSIYGLTMGHLINSGSFNKVIGPITPIGGILLLFGWLRAIVTVSKIKID